MPRQHWENRPSPSSSVPWPQATYVPESTLLGWGGGREGRKRLLTAPVVLVFLVSLQYFPYFPLHFEVLVIQTTCYTSKCVVIKGSMETAFKSKEVTKIEKQKNKKQINPTDTHITPTPHRWVPDIL